MSARKRALLFLRAFLRYQRGGNDPPARTALAQTASGALVSYLAAQPASPARGARGGKVLSLRLYARGRREAKASALLRYGRERSLFEFRLRRERGGWRVLELYP